MRQVLHALGPSAQRGGRPPRSDRHLRERSPRRRPGNAKRIAGSPSEEKMKLRDKCERGRVRSRVCPRLVATHGVLSDVPTLPNGLCPGVAGRGPPAVRSRRGPGQEERQAGRADHQGPARLHLQSQRGGVPDERFSPTALYASCPAYPFSGCLCSPRRRGTTHRTLLFGAWPDEIVVNPRRVTVSMKNSGPHHDQATSKRDNMSEQGIWEQYQSLFSATGDAPIVEGCIRALEALPGMSESCPDPCSIRAPSGGWIAPQYLIFWGLPLTYLCQESSFDRVRAQMGKSLGANQPPDCTLMSELNAAALLKALGAERVIRIGETDHTTPDYHFWWSGELVELEVTRADPKPSRFQLRQEQEFFTAEISKLGLPWNFILHIVHPWPREISLRVLRDAEKLKPGEFVEETGKWRLRAEEPNRLANYHVIGQPTDQPPSWWPEQSARMCALRQVVGAPTPVSAPQVRVQYTVPVTTYINPVAKKNDHFQGSDTAPFLIAIDVTALPHGFEILRAELPEWFVGWKRVSGVLILHGPAFIGVKIGWEWGLIPNPHANYQLPRAMLESVPALAQRKDLAFPLRISGEGPVTITGLFGSG